MYANPEMFRAAAAAGGIPARVKNYLVTGMALIIAQFISVWAAPKLGYVSDINIASIILLLVIGAGVTWFFDITRLIQKIPRKWEYILICAVSGALYNMVLTGVNAYPYSLLGTILPQVSDPTAILRGAIIGGVGGLIVAIIDYAMAKSSG